MKRLMSICVSAAMAVAALPVGNLPVRAAQAGDIEFSEPVGGWNESEMVYVSGDEAVEVPGAVRVSGRLYYSPQENFWASCASTNGRDSLPKEAQKAFYDKIDAAATSFMESNIDLQPSYPFSGSDGEYYFVDKITEDGDMSLTAEELVRTYNAYDYDHPAYYWIDNRSVYSDDYIYLVTNQDYAKASVREGINSAIISGVNAYKVRADYAEDTLDKIAIIHDAIIEDIDYAYRSVEGGRIPETEKWAHSVHGVFSDHKAAVCEGYSDTFAMMMNYMGIPNYYVVGESINSNGSRGGHAWNMVSVDGSKYMYMDLTWDDLTEKGFFYKHFGMPKSDFEESHIANTPTSATWLYAIPTNCTNTFEETYYYKAGYYFNGSNADTVAKRMRTSAQRFRNEVSFAANSTDNLGTLLQKWGRYSYSFYTISYKGTNYYVYVGTLSDKTNITGATVGLPQTEYDYNGSAVTPEPVVTCNGVKLIKGLNYTVSYTNNNAAGTGTVTVTGTGNFTGSSSAEFTITEGQAGPTVKNLEDILVKLASSSFEYNGSIKKPQVTVKDGAFTLEEGKDYTVTCDDNVDAGDYDVTVTGMGDYTGSVVLSYTITPTQLYSSWVAVEKTSYTYDGTAKTPAVTVTAGSKKLVEGTDYTLSYTNNVSAGSNTAYAVVKGKGNYTETIKKSFSIAAADISDAQMTLSETSYTYDGSAKTPAVTLVLGTKTLTNVTDYTVDYDNNTSAGTAATVIAKGTGNYTGTKSATFTILPKELTSADMTLSENRFTYDGLEKKPTVTVKDGTKDVPLSEYNVAYSNNVEVGTGTVTVTDKEGGNYNVAGVLTFEIVEDNEHKLTLVPAKDATCTEDGNKAYYTCSHCDKLFEDAEGTKEIAEKDTVVKAEGHKLTAHEEFKPTCTEDGKKAYWECSECKKLFADAEGKTETTEAELIVKTEGHKLTHVDAVEATVEKEGNIEYWTCSECGKYFADAEGKTEITEEQIVLPKSEHKLTLVPAKDATCTEDGNKAYYTCSHCDKLFEDAEGTKEIAEKDTVVKAEGHKLTAHEEVKPTCTEDGKKAYWECSECKKLFADKDGKTETTETELMVKTEGHKLIHVEAVEATTEKEGNIEYWSCSECGKYFADAAGKTEITAEEIKLDKLINIAAATVSGLGNKAWTGSAIKPVVTVKLGGVTLKKDTDYIVSYSNNTSAGTATINIGGIGKYGGTLKKNFAIKKVNLKYRAYVQKKSWMSWTTAGIGTTVNKSKFAGTTDNLRMETIQMQLTGISGSVKYRAYVEKMGWTQWATTADKTTYAGTKGMSRRVEMIQLKASGQVANLYDMYYRTYCEKFGWLGWAGNNAKSGSAGYARKLEAFQIQFVPKGTKFNTGTAKAFYDKAKDGEQ